jgi:formylglycine-generating enzyme required for sulfatase activity
LLKHHGAAVATLLLGLCPTQNYAEPLDVYRDCDVCPEMVELPLGEFMMGAPDDEFRHNLALDSSGQVTTATSDNPALPEKGEGPQHTVVIDIHFAIGKYEITYAEWAECVNDGGCRGYTPDGIVAPVGSEEDIIRAVTDPRFKDIPSEDAILDAVSNGGLLTARGRYPVLNVSYLDAQSYVAWLNAKLGTKAYRLPTEAEWEYAARAGTTTPFAQGLEPTPDQINISSSFTELILLEDRIDLRTLGYPVPVDEMDAANPWGLYHMSGNVEEITLSCYTERYEGWSTSSLWLERSFGPECKRSVRGGAYGSAMSGARVASRRDIKETYRPSFTGFRIVKELN